MTSQDSHSLRPIAADVHVDALFGDDVPGDHRRTRLARRIRAAALVMVLAALVAAAVVVGRGDGSTATGYRTATVSRRDVAAELSSVAVVEPVAQASVGFPVAGTVATLDVAVGDAVSAGQSLATLDPADLVDALHAEQATVDRAELVLASALLGESTVGAVTQSTATTAAEATGTTAAASVLLVSAPATTAVAGPTVERNAPLAAAQDDVVAGQRAVDAALADAQHALATAATVCDALSGDTSSTAIDACRTALEAVVVAQEAVGTAQTELAAAASVLDGLLLEAAATSSSNATSGSPSPSSSVPSTTAPASSAAAPAGATPGASPSAGSSTPSSAQLIAYQAAIDAAAADVAVAEQAVAQATIVSPLAGTVVAVGLATGDDVTAASSTQVVTIAGSGGYEVVTNVGLADIAEVAVGQAASLVPDGSDEHLAGTVTAISSVPDPSSSTSSFRVTVALADSAADLGNGATGTVTFTNEVATATLVVPTSAVATDGDRHTVSVVDGSGVAQVSVDVGVVGEEWTEVTRGVTAGQRVVLAELDAALPGTATDATTSSDTSGASTGNRPTGVPPAGFQPGAN